MAMAFTISCTVKEQMCEEDVICVKEPCDPIPVPCSTLRSDSSEENQSSSSGIPDMCCPPSICYGSSPEPFDVCMPPVLVGNEYVCEVPDKGCEKAQSSSSSSVQSSSSGILRKYWDARDDKYYEFVKIGTQIWMTENMNYNAPGSVCYDPCPDCDWEYDCDKDNGFRLYDLRTAIPETPKTDYPEPPHFDQASCDPPPNMEQICPSGWHLPSDDEWTKLTNFVGSNAGTKLKSKDYNGTDTHYFNAIPIRRYRDDIAGGWWSSTEESFCPEEWLDCYIWISGAHTRRVSYDASDVFKEISAYDKLNAVRCVLD